MSLVLFDLCLLYPISLAKVAFSILPEEEVIEEHQQVDFDIIEVNR
jgi:hypothetical protein